MHRYDTEDEAWLEAARSVLERVGSTVRLRQRSIVVEWEVRLPRLVGWARQFLKFAERPGKFMTACDETRLKRRARARWLSESVFLIRRHGAREHTLGRSSHVSQQGQGKPSFFEKKEAKKLWSGCRGTFFSVHPGTKSFLVLFFKKEPLAFSCG